MILDDNNIFLHSAVLCYNNKGILVIGDFNSGKTTLCLKAQEKNIKVVSSDKSHLYYFKDQMLLKRGSTYMKINENNEMVLDNDNCEIEIKLIINLIGACKSGKMSFYIIDNKDYIIKKMFKCCTWHSDIPLFTKNIMLSID